MRSRLLELHSPALNYDRLLRLVLLIGLLGTLTQVQPDPAAAGFEQQVVIWFGRFSFLFLVLLLSESLSLRMLAERQSAVVSTILMPTLFALLPMTVLEMIVESLVQQPEVFDDSDVGGIGLQFVSEYGTLLSIVLPLNLFLWIVIERVGFQETTSQTQSLTPNFLKKLVNCTMGDVIAIEADEHYIRVHSLRGEELIYYRFGDAINELAGFDGFQAHRSWWVARSAIKRLLKEGRRKKLELNNGLIVPVSRSGEKALHPEPSNCPLSN